MTLDGLQAWITQFATRADTASWTAVSLAALVFILLVRAGFSLRHRRRVQRIIVELSQRVSTLEADFEQQLLSQASRRDRG